MISVPKDEEFIITVPRGHWQKRGGVFRAVKYGELQVTAKPVSEYVYIHPTILEENSWTVTHLSTGYSLMTGLPDEKTARTCAKILACILPVEKDKHRVNQIRRAYQQLPVFLRRWVSQWRFIPDGPATNRHKSRTAKVATVGGL